MTRHRHALTTLCITLSFLYTPVVAQAQSYDGQWSVSESVNATACGEGNYVDSYTAVVAQNGNSMTVTASGITRSGTINGNTLSFSATYPEDNGSVSSTGTIVFSGNSASGSSNWTYTEGSLSCTGSSTISASRISTPTPAPSPAPTPAPGPAAPGAPAMSFTTSGSTLAISWNAVENATGYLLYYAPYPSADPVAAIDVGGLLSISGDLPVGTAMYIALQSYNAAGEGGISNVGNFKIKGVDVIEIANQSSDISAIVYGQQNANAVLFNDSGTTSTVQFKFDDNQSATLISDSQGNPMQFDIAGHTFVYTYGGGEVRTTLTEPNGTQSTVVENDPFATSLRKPVLVYDGCGDHQTCADARAASWDSADEEALEESINTNGGALQRISGSALACPFWMPSSACTALDGYLAQSENLYERLSDRVTTEVERIGTQFKCLTGSSECAAVAAEQAPAAVAEIKQFDTAPSQPTARFNISADTLQPDPDTWATYLAEAGFEMVDVPCAESVFASIRPECGGGTTTPGQPGENNEPPANGGGGTTEESIAECTAPVPASASAGEEGCYNKDGWRTGEWKSYITSLGVRFLHHTSVYSDNANIVFKTSYSIPVGNTPSYKLSEETRVDKKLEGEYRLFFEDGSLKATTTFTANVANGPHKSWWEPGALKEEGAFLNGKQDGHWIFYRIPTFQISAGVKSEEGNYLDGNRVGVWTSYSTNGSVSGTTNY